MAADMMVWNITKDKVTERMAVSPDEAWPVAGTARRPRPQKGQPPVFSKFILEGRWNEGAQPAQKRMLDEFMKKYNLENQDWRKQMMKK
jgi:hypothetical protein